MQSMDTTKATVEAVKELIVELLGIGDRADSLDASTGLLGSLPELDSMAVVELMAALEDRFGITVDDSDITADTFETIGSLAAYVDGRSA